MIWCRFQIGEDSAQRKTSFGILETTGVTEVWGNPLDDYAVSNHVYPLDEVKPARAHKAGDALRRRSQLLGACRGYGRTPRNASKLP